MRILVCGSRDWTDRQAIESALADAMGWTPPHFITVVHGGCRGADTLARDVAIDTDMHHECYPADWDTHGRSAGPIRNADMIRRGADLVLAFGDGVGTRDCVAKAEQAGIPVRRIGIEDDHDAG